MYSKILLLLYMHAVLYLFCTHYPYFICFIAVILNTLFAFYVLCIVALRKIAQMSKCYQIPASCILYPVIHVNVS